MNCRLVSALQKILNATAGSLLVLIICVVTTAQTPPPTLTLTASFAGKESVAPTELIEFKLSRALQTSEKIAVLIGQTDATNLFTINNDSLSFLPAPFALPNGKTEITVYLIATNDEWQELARFPIQVTSLTKASAPTTTTTTTNNSAASQPTQEKRRRFGMERLSFTPTFTLGFKSQFGGSFFPVTNKPERPKFFDTTLQGSLKGEMSRGTMNANLQFDLVGSSFRKEALRFNRLFCAWTRDCPYYWWRVIRTAVLQHADWYMPGSCFPSILRYLRTNGAPVPRADSPQLSLRRGSCHC